MQLGLYDRTIQPEALSTAQSVISGQTHLNQMSSQLIEHTRCGHVLWLCWIQHMYTLMHSLHNHTHTHLISENSNTNEDNTNEDRLPFINIDTLKSVPCGSTTNTDSCRDLYTADNGLRGWDVLQSVVNWYCYVDCLHSHCTLGQHSKEWHHLSLHPAIEMQKKGTKEGSLHERLILKCTHQSPHCTNSTCFFKGSAQSKIGTCTTLLPLSLTLTLTSRSATIKQHRHA